MLCLSPSKRVAGLELGMGTESWSFSVGIHQEHHCTSLKSFLGLPLHSWASQGRNYFLHPQKWLMVGVRNRSGRNWGPGCPFRWAMGVSTMHPLGPTRAARLASSHLGHSWLRHD